MARRILRIGIVATAGLAFLVLGIMMAGIVLSRPQIGAPPGEAPASYADKRGDEELAYLLVKLELRTRAVVAGHYSRSQSSVPGVDLIYKRWMAKNLMLPAAVADQVFSEVVPGATGGRAWVKMVVDNPRNPHNRGDAVALELLQAVRQGSPNAERATAEAYYYAEPIRAKSWCLSCHGQPAGEPDPLFPRFKKDGWRDGDIVGAVVARVAPKRVEPQERR